MEYGINFGTDNIPAYYGERNEDLVICTPPNVIPTNGIWQGENILQYELPLLVVQITLIVLFTRALHLILKPLHQHRMISEILVGVILGPSGLCSNQFGRITGFSYLPENEERTKVPKLWTEIFPMRSVMMLETMANVGLIYFAFLMGVETDLRNVKRVGRKGGMIALASLGISFVVASFVSIHGDNESFDRADNFLGMNDPVDQFVFMGVAMAVTSFPTIARILTEQKLIHTELGKITMSSAIIVDISLWIIVSLVMFRHSISSLDGLGRGKEKTLTQQKWSMSLYFVFFAVLFVLFCVYILHRYVILRLIRRNSDGENFKRDPMPSVLTGVMTCALVTDSLGLHFITGAFVFGLMIPNGPLAAALVEKLEDFMCSLLVPLFYVVIGLKTNIIDLNMDAGQWTFFFGSVLGTSALRVCITSVISFYQKIELRDGITLGVLMNSKGLVHLVFLNIFRDRKIIGNRAFTVGVLTQMFVAAIIAPLVAFINKSASTRGLTRFKNRTFQRLANISSEVRIVTCVHLPRQVPAIINLLETSNPCKEHPIGVYTIHLVELTGHGASSMLVANSGNNSADDGPLTHTQAQSDHIVKAFENFQKKCKGSYVRNLTIASPFSTMHEDICNCAEEKCATFIILPFHRQQTVDGTMEDLNPEYRKVNQNVLANAPCTVGILVDRGLTLTSRETSHHIAMIFFGGPDDREALAYAQQMVSHLSVTLTVFRFLESIDVEEAAMSNDSIGPVKFTEFPDEIREKRIDNEYIRSFREKSVSNELIAYTEMVVNNVEETIKAIHKIDKIHDFYIVGRGQDPNSPLTEGLSEWSEFPELGVIGDLLASSDFEGQMSVLVIQQYPRIEEIP